MCVSDTDSEIARQARTPLGKRLRELRRRIVACGQPLLGWEALDCEIAQLKRVHDPQTGPFCSE